MFDIGFSELLLIGVIALIVLGPERLPKLARTLGALLGRLNRYASQVKQDIDREMQLDELRKMQKDMQDSAQKYQIMASERVQEVEAAVQQETSQLDKVMQAMSATDGGLTMQEWDKVKEAEKLAEVAVSEASPSEVPALPDNVEAAESQGVTPAISAEAAEPAPSQAVRPAAKIAHADDYPNGPVG